MERYRYTSRPVWVQEGDDVTKKAVIETAMVMDGEKKEFRRLHTQVLCNGHSKVSPVSCSGVSCNGSSYEEK